MSSSGQKRCDAARFEALVAAYGADLRKWPSEERGPAEEFLRTSRNSADARLLEDARAFDALLELPDLDPSPSLQQGVAEIPLRNPRALASDEGLAFWPFSRLRQVFAVLAAAAAMGAAFGVALPDTSAVDQIDSAWDDFSMLASGVDLPGAEELAP